MARLKSNIKLERNKVNVHLLDPIFVTNFNPDPNTTILVCFVLKGFIIELFLKYSDKNSQNTIEPRFKGPRYKTDFNLRNILILI